MRSSACRIVLSSQMHTAAGRELGERTNGRSARPLAEFVVNGSVERLSRAVVHPYVRFEPQAGLQPCSSCSRVLQPLADSQSRALKGHGSLAHGFYSGPHFFGDKND